jgi:outer membrane protein assembly factor BamB
MAATGLAVGTVTAGCVSHGGSGERLRVLVTGPHGLAPIHSDVVAALFTAGDIVRIDERGRVVYRVAVGKHPTNPTVEGENVWVPTVGDHRVVEIEAASGRVVRTVGGTYAAAIAGPPGAIFLPTWIKAPRQPTRWRGNAVTRLETRTGKVVWRRSFSGIVLTVAYRAGEVWVPNFAGDTVAILNARTGATVVVAKVPGRPVGVAVGDRCAWVALAGGGLLRLQPRTAHLEGTTAMDGNYIDYMIAADDGVWLSPYASQTVAHIEHVSCRTGRIDGRIDANGASQGLAVTGSHLWAADYERGEVVRLRKNG